MATYISSSQIIKKIGCKHLELVRGSGYWYFIYDNKSDKYDTKSVYSMYLGNDIDYWVREGKEFVTRMEE